jgi:Carboxypeptidase regulatory-like domain/TonB-dependent Receptor Plug Domain
MRTPLLRMSVLFFSFFLAISAFGQTTASVTGTVTDSSGAAVPNAEVTVTMPERGLTRTTSTNGSGEYLLPALPVGTVSIAVTAAGFQKYIANGVVLQVGQKVRNDVTLAVGATTTEVTVQGVNVGQVETQSSELAGTVTGKEISQLELNGRNFTQLVTLVPGVSNQTGQDEGQVGVGGSVAFSMNGGRTEYNNWELDGGDNMDNGSNTSLNVYPSLDAIAEFKVLTSNYGAQYGRNGSGTVEVETKSGTNQFHGDVYEFVRNDMFNAANFFEDSVPAYKKNDFGYTIGGPVFIPGLYNKDKQKTFFFWSQEWRRDRVPNPFSVTVVPSMAERSGDFSDLCPNTAADGDPFADCPRMPNGGGFYPGNQIPVDPSDPTINALEALIPEPNVGANRWQASPTLPTNWREELFRIDQNVNSKVRATFRYIHDSWDQLYPTPLWTAGTSFPTIQTNFGGPGVSMVARVTASVSPTLLNEFVFSYTTDHITLIPTGAWQRPDGMTLGLFQNGFGGKVPGIALGGGIFDGIAEDPGYLPNGPYNSNPSYTYRDNVSKSAGKHNLQFGASFVAAQKNELSAAGVSNNGLLNFSTDSLVTTGNAFADLLVGSVDTFQQQNVQLKYYNRYKIFEPYFQDDWRATNHLTLNLGLRMSLYGTYRERYHNAYNFDPSHYVPGASSVDPDTGLVIGDPFNGMVQCGVTAGVPDACMKGHLFNPAPRIGFAWDPSGNGKMAIRGGYGVFFEHTNGNEANSESLESSPPGSLIPSIHNIQGYQNIVPQDTGSTSPLAVVSIPNKAVWPYVQQWHLDVQRDISHNMVATVSYVGSKGTHLTRQYDLNQVAPTPLSENPYNVGEAIGPNDCDTMTTPSGVAVTGQAAINLSIACGASPEPFRPFTGIGAITRREETASSTYHALQASLRRNVGGLQLSLAYTYSHSIDDSSSGVDANVVNAYDFPSDRASSNFDQRHIFSLGYVYDLPFFKGRDLKGKLLGGWQWSGITTIQSGVPFNVTNGGAGSVPSDNAGVGNGLTNFASYVDVVGDPHSFSSGPSGDFGPTLYNASAFAAPRGLTFGDMGRNVLTNPSRTNFDMALFKHFAIKENLGFEFRAEAFNIFNHTEFGGPDGTCTELDSDNHCVSGNGFLQVSSAHNPRIMQFGLKFIF